MTMVTSYDIGSNAFTHHTPQGTAADTWRQAVQTEAARMQANAPELHERIAAATTLVLDNKVELALDGHATVASRSAPGLRHVVNGTCGCQDAAYNTPYCAHRLAVGILKRATQHLAAPAAAPEPPRACCPRCFVSLEMGDGTCDCTPLLEPQGPPPAPAPATGCPEAVFSATLKGLSGGLDALYTARGQTWETFQANLAHIRSLFDAPTAPPAQNPAAPEGTQMCPIHDRLMTRQSNERGWWLSHPTDDGGWCKGKAKRGR